MPVYEYQCPECEACFEEMVRADDRDKAVICPECSSRRAARRLSVFAAHGAAGKSAATQLPRSACGRCGDPNGPCGNG